MDDIEAAAARSPPRAPPPPTTPGRAATAEMKAAAADAVIYSFVSAMFVCGAASIALLVARYPAAAGRSSYAHAVVALAMEVFLRAFVAEVLLSPFTILLLLLRLDRQRPEPPEELVLVRDSNPFPSRI
ncbi:hypothetical protein BAE44_0013654, partial [Dichanthelium oligosanthes]